MDVEQREYVVSGFAFYSERDAGLAEQERQKIAYLDKHIDHADMQSVLAIYKKALEDRVFRTPVGLEYLRELQGELRAREEELGEKVPPDLCGRALLMSGRRRPLPEDGSSRCRKTGAKRRASPVSDHEYCDARGNHCHVCDHIEFRPTQYPELRAESSE